MPNSSKERASRTITLVWIGVALLFGFLLFPTMVQRFAAWPPAFMERRAERRLLAERVQSAGGWSALVRDCERLGQQYKEEGSFFWTRARTNSLPPAIAALRPMVVTFGRGASFGFPDVATVQIKLFGLHSTGGHSTPLLGVVVVLGQGSTPYKPGPVPSYVGGGPYCTYRAVTNSVYEYF